jgi:hypothetical protein
MIGDCAYLSDIARFLVPCVFDATERLRQQRTNLTFTLALKFWTSDRRVMMAPTPIAMHTKKNSSRCHEARISRNAILATNFIESDSRLHHCIYDIFDNRTFAQSDPPVSTSSERMVVSNQQQRGSAIAIQFEEKIKNHRSVAGVKVPCRLVRQQNWRIVRKGPRDCDPLLFASR